MIRYGKFSGLNLVLIRAFPSVTGNIKRQKKVQETRQRCWRQIKENVMAENRKKRGYSYVPQKLRSNYSDQGRAVEYCPSEYGHCLVVRGF